MKKSMYSIMLMDSIVNNLDSLAYERNTNRSNLINQILADYLSVETPEMKIKEIFNLISITMDEFMGFKIQAVPSDFIISIKSPLTYKYRPTIKYSVELYRENETYIGEFRVVFRTQHNELLTCLSNFFDVWTELEKFYIHKYFPKGIIKYTVDDGRFKRTLMIPKHSDKISNEVLGKAIGDYIKMFDDIMKLYLNNFKIDYSDIEKKYVNYLNESFIPI